MTQLDLLKSPYPNGIPGFKEKGGASEDAAKAVTGKSSKLRAEIYDLLGRYDNLTYKEIVHILGEDRDNVKPRLSELFEQNRIIKTQERRERCTAWARA